MLNWGPITYYTDVNSLVYNYYDSIARNYTYFSNPINFLGKMNFGLVESPTQYINFGGQQNNNCYQSFLGVGSANNNFTCFNPFTYSSSENLYNNNQYKFSYYDIWGGHSVRASSPIAVSDKKSELKSLSEPDKTSSKQASSQVSKTKVTQKTTNNKDSIDANKKISASNPAKLSKSPPKQTLGSEFLKVANKYSNCNEFDNTHLKFCTNSGCNQANSGEWCTDFVSYIVKEAYANKGRSAPSGFGTHDVGQLKNWAKNNNMFISTANVGKKAQFITNNIKPGDIFILNENGASHTGFVSQVHPDGSFSTIEGNRDDKVSRYRYSPDYGNLSGFIRMS